MGDNWPKKYAECLIQILCLPLQCWLMYFFTFPDMCFPNKARGFFSVLFFSQTSRFCQLYLPGQMLNSAHPTTLIILGIKNRKCVLILILHCLWLPLEPPFKNNRIVFKNPVPFDCHVKSPHRVPSALGPGLVCFLFSSPPTSKATWKKPFVQMSSEPSKARFTKSLVQ